MNPNRLTRDDLQELLRRANQNLDWLTIELEAVAPLARGVDRLQEQLAGERRARADLEEGLAGCIRGSTELRSRLASAEAALSAAIHRAAELERRANSAEIRAGQLQALLLNSATVTTTAKGGNP